MPVSEKTYHQVALEDPSGRWELHCGHLRQKPNMTAEHNQTMSRLCRQLYRQLDESAFDVRADFGTVRRSSQSYYIPDVYVVPLEQARAQLGTGRLEVFTGPLPLVVEVWSPSTGDYDVDTKLPEYQARGDLEIWLLHPYERTLTSWRRQPDGSYAESHHAGGPVQPSALPGVTVDLDTLFA
jgi:Uma2 family endonuclease